MSLPEASANAHQVDFAFFALLGGAVAIFVGLLAVLVVFSIRYREGRHAKHGILPELLSREIEIGWTVATLFLGLFIFWWFVGGTEAPFQNQPGQLEIHVVAKQWMWKTEHPSGAREIDALHLPQGQPTRLVMTSQDVIHSFFVPAFRLKQDVLPDRDTELVFTPTRLGRYHLFCAEYCGTQHSHMTGEIDVMTPAAYQEWELHQPKTDTQVGEGAALFASLGCEACHGSSSQVKAPKLAGLYRSQVTLADGRTVTADEAYLRRSLTDPRADLVAGYQPIMPSYGDISDHAEVDALIAYLQSLSSQASTQ